jgi:hypothetical protein
MTSGLPRETDILSIRRHVSEVPVSDFARLFEAGALPDIGRATATMCLGIADATPTAAANEIACRRVG